MNTMNTALSRGVFFSRGIAATVGRTPKIAVVLSGSGVYDGSEIHEASAILVNLSRYSADVKMYAPDKPQHHVINHIKGEEMQQERNVLVESARIARGKVDPLSQLLVEEHDAVVFPGGFGAAKNLCDYAIKQAECTLDKDVERIIKGFHSSGKPMGFTCIAPVLVAKALKGVEITVGGESGEGGCWPYAGTVKDLKTLGANHIAKDTVKECHVDAVNKVVTVPAFMGEAPLADIFDGIAGFVAEVVKLTEK